MPRKGISLPIRMLVVLAIAVIVLLAIVVLFTGTFPGGAGQVSEEQKVSVCCSEYVRQGACRGEVSMDTISDSVGYNCSTLVPSPNMTCCGGVSE